MQLKICKLTLALITSLVLFSCGGSKQPESKYVGKTYKEASELELFTGGRDIPVRWMHFSKDAPEQYEVSFMTSVLHDYSPENLHIFLVVVGEDGETKTIVAEMDIDRTTNHFYSYSQLEYIEDGEHKCDNFLCRTNGDSYVIEDVYIVDVDNLTFTAVPNVDGQYFECV